MSNISKFNDKDIKFLKRETKLSLVKLLSLLEEESDSDLLIDSISSRNYRRKRLKVLSIYLLNKLTLFKHTKNTDFDIKEKSYICDVIIKNLPLVMKEKNMLSKDMKASERNSEYYLIMTGFFEEIINLNKTNYSLNYYISFIENGFRWHNREKVAAHTQQWVGILKEIKKDYLTTLKN